MTDKPEPTAEHIDAVAQWLCANTHSDPDWTPPQAVPTSDPRTMVRACFACGRNAHDFLTSTDPAVHAAQAANLPTDAMLTALVERGALSRDRERLRRDCGCFADGTVLACCDPTAPPHWVTRYVTPWEPTP